MNKKNHDGKTDSNFDFSQAAKCSEVLRKRNVM